MYRFHHFRARALITITQQCQACFVRGGTAFVRRRPETKKRVANGLGCSRHMAIHTCPSQARAAGDLHAVVVQSTCLRGARRGRALLYGCHMTGAAVLLWRVQCVHACARVFAAFSRFPLVCPSLVPKRSNKIQHTAPWVLYARLYSRALAANLRHTPPLTSMGWRRAPAVDRALSTSLPE